MTKDGFIAYTDGSCIGNPGVGGWAVVLLWNDGDGNLEKREANGHEPRTTNNRMELKAAIEALSMIPESSKIHVCTDSTYLRMGITHWIHNWRNNGWRTKTGNPVKNKDMWVELDELRGLRRVTWKWVKGHASNKWNNRADELAREASDSASGRRHGENQSPTAHSQPQLETDYVGYVSASCKGGQGPGGWGLVLVKDAGKANPVVLHERGGEALSSSNRMTLVAAVEALSKVSGNASITILSNNTYITNGMNSWVHNWKRNGWKSGSGRSPIKNVDLWKQLLELTRERHVRWRSDMSNSDRKWVAEAANLARQAVSEVRDQCP